MGLLAKIYNSKSKSKYKPRIVLTFTKSYWKNVKARNAYAKKHHLYKTEMNLKSPNYGRTIYAKGKKKNKLLNKGPFDGI